MTPDVADLGLVEAAAAVASGAVSPVELVAAAIRRIDCWEPEVMALKQAPLDVALDLARQRATEAISGELQGPLHGVPVMVKDVIDVEGWFTTASSKILADNVATQDASVVARLRAAGAIILAKTNTHEFAYGGETPPTRNPWDTDRMTGGSSGGSAAAVATHMCHGALGTDTGSSIREPAALCGLIGHKPTYGRVSTRGVVPVSWSLDTVGPLCRSAEDASMLLSVIEGHDPADPTSVSVTTPPRRGHDLNGLKVAIATELMGPNAEGVDAVLTSTLEALESNGATIESVSIGDRDELIAAAFVILRVEAAAFHRPWLETRLSEYRPDVQANLEMGFRFTGVDYVDAQRYRRAARDRLNTIFSSHNLLFAPSQHIVAPRITDKMATFADGSETSLDLALSRPLTPFNLTGHCATSVPITNIDGLPVGVQFVGAPFADHEVLGFAASLHQLLDWKWSAPAVPSPGKSTSIDNETLR